LAEDTGEVGHAVLGERAEVFDMPKKRGKSSTPEPLEGLVTNLKLIRSLVRFTLNLGPRGGSESGHPPAQSTCDEDRRNEQDTRERPGKNRRTIDQKWRGGGGNAQQKH